LRTQAVNRIYLITSPHPKLLVSEGQEIGSGLKFRGQRPRQHHDRGNVVSQRGTTTHGRADMAAVDRDGRLRTAPGTLVSFVNSVNIREMHCKPNSTSSGGTEAGYAHGWSSAKASDEAARRLGCRWRAKRRSGCAAASGCAAIAVSTTCFSSKKARVATCSTAGRRPFPTRRSILRGRWIERKRESLQDCHSGSCSVHRSVLTG